MEVLKSFLEGIGLDQYFSKLVENGYDDLEFLKSRTELQLREIGKLIDMKHGHIEKLVEAIIVNNSGNVNINNDESAYIGIVFDRSGSMAQIINDAIGGYNQFISEQKKLDNCVISVVKFDDRIDLVYENRDIRNIPNATPEIFSPRGSTALLDAIKYTIDISDKYIDNQTVKPGKVMIVILTDGEENSSRKCSRSELFKLIKDHEKEKNWEFIFLSANKDAIQAGTSMGMKGSNCIDWSRNKSKQVFNAASRYATRNRKKGAAIFTQEDRDGCV